MIADDVRALLEDEDEGVIMFDNLDEAVIGLGRQFTKPMVVYDYEKCIEILMRDMSREDAEEYFEFNTQGLWAGEYTPVILYRPDPGG